MASMTFLIDDDSTTLMYPVVQVTITENPNGSLTFTLTQVGGAGSFIGDLRGFFFDVKDESLLGSLTASGTGLTELRQGSENMGDTVVDLGDGANMQGLLNADGTKTTKVAGFEANGYDVGVEIGTAGIGSDDYQTFSFTLSSSERALTLTDFEGSDFGMRITSVGQDLDGNGSIDTSRDGSAKVVEDIGFAPVAVNDTRTATEDVALDASSVLTNDTNAEPSEDLDVSAVKVGTTTIVDGGAGDADSTENGSITFTTSAGGTATINLEDGTFSYDQNGVFNYLDADETGGDSFQYEITDGVWHSNLATVSIQINGVDDAMVVVDDIDSLGEDAVQAAVAGTTDVLDNDSDPDTSDNPLVVNDTAAQAVYELDAGGNLTGTVAGSITFASGGTYTLTLDAAHQAAANALDDGESFKVGVVYTAENQDGDTADATLRIQIDGATDAPPNQAPVANNDIWVLSNDTVLTIPLNWLLNNDTDADGNALNITSVTESLSWLTPNFVSTNLASISIAAGGTGPATFTYTIDDGFGGIDTASVTINFVQTTGTANTVDLGLIFSSGYDFSYVDAKQGIDSVTGATFIAGTAGIDNFLGSGASDTLDGKAGADTLNGGEGADILVWDALDILVDGGTSVTNPGMVVDVDTLRVSGNLNLTSVPDAQIENIERIDLTDFGSDTTAETLALNAQDVLDVEAAGNKLYVMGNEAAGPTKDSVDIDASLSWNGTTTAVFEGVTYNVYTGTASSTAVQVLIEQNLNVI